ncbi:large ribosomal subunit protein mL66-like [Ptychodera flava]|uniref:large ribosomal subunit protein mL66-like n=1 Tax=Ptychodera flava TaxID=63121 RepID=UPI003969E0B4
MSASLRIAVRQCFQIGPTFWPIFRPFMSISSLSRSHISLLSRRIIPRVQVCQYVTYRQVKETKEDNVTTVEAVYIEDDSKTLSDENPHSACPLCRLNRMISYKDVLIIRQFIREDGGLLPGRITGICRKQQKHLEKVLQQAHRAGLLPNHRPKLPDGSIARPKRKFYRF